MKNQCLGGQPAMFSINIYHIVFALCLGLQLSITVNAETRAEWQWPRPKPIPNSRPADFYNLKNVIELSGEVKTIQEEAQPQDRYKMRYILVNTTDSGVIEVRLAPQWFLEMQQKNIRVGDKVEIVGSIAIVGKRSIILASQVTRGNDVMVLRGKDGYPVWRIWR